MNSKKSSIASAIAVFAFVAFAGVTAFSVLNVSDLASRSSFSGRDGVPTAWTGTTYSAPVSTSTEVKIVGDHLSYVATIENKEPRDVYLTDIASLVSDDKHNGFIAFNPNSVEYSYSKTSTSWDQLVGTSADGVYKLNHAVRIGAAGTSSNRLYLRYNLSPEFGNVTDKISFRVADAEGNYSVAVSDSSIAYEETASEIVAASSSRTSLDENSGESAFAEPLGAFSENSDLSTISTTTAAIAAISPESTTASTIIIIAILGLFVGSLIAFLVIKNQKSTKTKAKSSKK